MTENTGRATCTVCPHGCKLNPGQVGRCRARGWRDGRVESISYGRITSVALDPVEKKPLVRWMPGHLLLSVGSYGCNLSCPFCQNYSISQAGENDVPWQIMSPEELVSLTQCRKELDSRVVGIAHTYNEPLITWEYVRDVGLLAHEAGLSNVIVSNGCVNQLVADEVAPLIDAANIDLKGFSDEFYRWCGGGFATVQSFIERLAAEPSCHLEVTCLIIPGRNDSPGDMRNMSRWLASVDNDITLHITRYFPRWHLTVPATPIETLFELADIAEEALPHVVVGNVGVAHRR